jgi:Bacterial regulatory helix-turn-helix protein, lysR family
MTPWMPCDKRHCFNIYMSFCHVNLVVVRSRLPSLNGLRAFEAAARYLSFTRAAVELNVTQTAVSHQIRRLEEQLG